MLEFLNGKKAYLTAAAGIVTALALFANGDVDTQGLVTLLLNALGIATLRAGVAKGG